MPLFTWIVMGLHYHQSSTRGYRHIDDFHTLNTLPVWFFFLTPHPTRSFPQTAQEQAFTDHCWKKSPSFHSTCQSTTDDPVCCPMWLYYHWTSLVTSHQQVNIEVILFTLAIPVADHRSYQPPNNKKFFFFFSYTPWDPNKRTELFWATDLAIPEKVGRYMKVTENVFKKMQRWNWESLCGCCEMRPVMPW